MRGTRQGIHLPCRTKLGIKISQGFAQLQGPVLEKASAVHLLVPFLSDNWAAPAGGTERRNGSCSLKSRSGDATTKGEEFCSAENIFPAGGEPWLVGQEESAAISGLFPTQVSTHVSVHSLGKPSKLARKAQSKTCKIHPCKVPQRDGTFQNFQPKENRKEE